MKYECKDCGSKCELITENVPEVCIKQRSRVNWKKVEEPAPKPLPCASKSAKSATQKDLSCRREKLPKLTAAVFDREDCPEWAQWAGVNQDGTASFFGNVPNRGCSNPRKNYWSYHYSEMKQIPGRFDASDWQNSLIERPEKKNLPDWVKVGAWVWCADCRAERKIEKINGNRITVRFPAPDATPYTGDMSEFKPIVPFTFETIAPLLPFAVMASKTFVNTIIGATEKGVYFSAATEVTSYDDLLYFCTRLDGSPCGVAEIAQVSK